MFGDDNIHGNYDDNEDEEIEQETASSEEKEKAVRLLSQLVKKSLAQIMKPKNLLEQLTRPRTKTRVTNFCRQTLESC